MLLVGTSTVTGYEDGRRFRYPAVGIDNPWRWYGCSYGGDPSGLGPGIWRWGCLGGKNIYLMSHASSTFSAIRRAYHNGTLRVGQRAYFSGRLGNFRAYRVKWIRRVTTTYFDLTWFQWAAIDTPTRMMTLQTCDGRYDQYRIIIRLRPI